MAIALVSVFILGLMLLIPSPYLLVDYFCSIKICSRIVIGGIKLQHFLIMYAPLLILLVTIFAMFIWGAKSSYLEDK
ncbi:cytochrome bd oxidase small subunit CydS [Metabacillus rhizosphaerae]|uniref:cytochrome bd oxidase small subunit CydS n=1 Tax=Metabacillus rhizosphaerae TaxID=3117747 RepID=UPI0039B75489